MVINPGEFKHPIIIKECKLNIDDDGIQSKIWIEKFRVRAKINNITGKEYIANNNEIYATTTRFTTRYINVSVTDIIEYKGNMYNIKHINNILELNKYVEIVAEKVD